MPTVSNKGSESSGFLLVELAVALAILTGIALMVASYQANNAVVRSAVDARLRATTQAAQNLDYYKLFGTLPTNENSGIAYTLNATSFTPRVVVQPEHYAARFKAPSVEKIELRATWRDALRRNQTMSLWCVGKAA